MSPRLARVWPWLLAGGTLALAGWIAGPALTAGPAHDPTSTGPAGAKAAVDVLRELDLDVRVGLDPAPGDRTALVLADTLDRTRRQALDRWVRAGGRLVVADPASPLLGDVAPAGDVGAAPVGPIAFPPACDDPLVADVREVTATTWTALAPGDGRAVTCFPLADGAWLVRSTRDAGEVVALGGADAFTNARLGESDNAVLLVRLLDPQGDGSVLVVDRAPPGAGAQTLWDLVPERVYLALLVLLGAFVLVAWSRGRRLGQPVDESLPVRVPASELVVASGHLLQRASARDAAAAVMRDGFRREAGTRLGLGPDAPPEVLAERLAGWSGADPEGVAVALGDAPPRDDAELVAVVRAVGRLRDALGRPAYARPPDQEAP